MLLIQWIVSHRSQIRSFYIQPNFNRTHLEAILMTITNSDTNKAVQSQKLVILFVLCLGVYIFFFYLFIYLLFFLLLAPYVRFHIFGKVRVTEWPPIGKIAAHSAYEMCSWYKYLVVSLFVVFFSTSVVGVGIFF